MSRKSKREESVSPHKLTKKPRDCSDNSEVSSDDVEPRSVCETLKSVVALLGGIHTDAISEETTQSENEMETLRNIVREQMNSLFPSTSTLMRKPKKKTRYVPTSMEKIYGDKPLFFEFFFENDLKRSVNPFDIENEIKNITTRLPKRIFSINRNKVIVEVESEEKSTNLTLISSVDGIPCRVSKYDAFNTNRGLIYVKHIDFSLDDALPSFKRWLSERYDIEDVTLATFITPKDKNTKALIVNFNTNNLPYTIYIHGEENDTKVYPFHNKPMRCNHCQNYGHTAKRCRSETPICRRCSLPDHKSDECTNEKLCYHCKGEHEAGSHICSKYIRETTLLKIQSEQKVSSRRAAQIERGENLNSVIQTDTYPDILDIRMSETDKRSFNPWLLDKCLSSTTGKIRNIRSINSEVYSVEVESRTQSREIMALTQLNSKPITVTISKRFDPPKGLAYIYEYNLCKFESFKEKLMERLSLRDVVLASWIKSKRNNSNAIPIMISFDQAETPEYISIPGEQALTKVYEYKDKPMLCKQCLEFGHTLKRCRNAQRCRNCTSNEHLLENCPSDQPSCHHCDSAHITGSGNCREMMYEQEILTIQKKNRITRTQAKLTFDRANPQFRTMHYGEAVINPRISTRKPITNSPRQQTELPTQTLTNKTPIIQIPASKTPIQTGTPDKITPPSPSTSAEVFQDDTQATREMFQNMEVTLLPDRLRESDQKGAPETSKNPTQSRETKNKKKGKSSSVDHNDPQHEIMPETSSCRTSKTRHPNSGKLLSDDENGIDCETYETDLRNSRKAKQGENQSQTRNKTGRSARKHNSSSSRENHKSRKDRKDYYRSRSRSLVRSTGRSK